MRWVVRAPTKDQLMVLRNRVKACFEFVWENDVYSCDVLIEVDSGAALSTSCGLKITMGVPYYDLLQNGILGKSESSPDFVQYLSLLCFFASGQLLNSMHRSWHGYIRSWIWGIYGLCEISSLRRYD